VVPVSVGVSYGSPFTVFGSLVCACLSPAVCAVRVRADLECLAVLGPVSCHNSIRSSCGTVGAKESRKGSAVKLFVRVSVTVLLTVSVLALSACKSAGNVKQVPASGATVVVRSLY
jgi:hypothetical protein